MTSKTQKAFNEWDMQDLSIGHKLREAKKLCLELEEKHKEMQNKFIRWQTMWVGKFAEELDSSTYKYALDELAKEVGEQP